MTRKLWPMLLLVFLIVLGPLATTLVDVAPVAIAGKHHSQHQQHDKHGHDKAKHKAKHHTAAKKTPPAESLVEPTPDLTTPVPKPTKKHRKTARATADVSTAALVNPPPAAAADALVTRYYGAADNHVDAYYPWQFNTEFLITDNQRQGKWKVTDCGPVCGFDVFPFGRTTSFGHLGDGGDKWVEFDVIRPVRVEYVWRDAGAKPSWLTAGNGWVADGTVVAKIQDSRGWVDTLTVYGKEFPKGRVAIPGPVAGNGTGIKQAPWILFGEKDGARPTKPTGYRPNQPCYVDANGKYDMDAHIADPKYKNRDGFPTWHLPYDPASHCYHDHDHGTDPALIFGADTAANMPSYGQVARLAGMSENHWGHKGYGITIWPEADFYIVMHFGTTGVGRFDTCKQRFHLVQVTGRKNGQVVYQVRGMLDFGEVVGVAKAGDDPADDHSINPPGCPNGNADAAAEARALGFSPGVRREAIDQFFAPVNEAGLAYGPWRFAKRYSNTLGIDDAFVVNTQDALDSYRSADDLTMVSQFDRSGTARFFTINQTVFHCPSLPATQRNAQGYWWTDPMGLTVYDLTNRPANAVRQFCLPGWNGTAKREAGTALAAHLSGPDATTWGGLYVPRSGGIPGDFENSITEAHGPN